MPGGRPKAEYSQALRLLKIVDMLQCRSHVTIAELMHEFDINRRTVQRDIAVLSEAYAIEEGDRTPENEKTFRLTPGSKAETLRVTISEMIGLYMGRNLFAFTKGTELKKAVDSLYDKLEARLDRRGLDVRGALPKKLYCTAGFPKSYRKRDDVVNALLTGLIKERKVAITYARPGKNTYPDVIHPYTLVLHNHALYVQCFSEYSGAQRTLAVERIKTADWKGNSEFDYPKRYSPQKVLGSAFGITTGQKPVQVRLRFSPNVAPYVESRQWHESMKSTSRRDGSLDVELRVAIGEELLHWLTGYGGHVRVLTPKSLREAICARHEEGAEAMA